MANCIFDGVSPTTNAHVFRKAWVAQICPRAYKFSHRLGARAHEPGPGKAQWVKDAIDLKVNSACARCNDGWMNNLDLAAEEIFLTNGALGYDVKVTSLADKMTLARWCGLIATLMDQTIRPPTLPKRVHQSLCAGDVPEDMQAWIFRTEPPEDKDVVWGASRHLTLTGVGQQTGTTNIVDVYFATFGIQQLVVHVALPTARTAAGIKLLRRASNPGVVREIWPAPLTPLIWPPPETLRWEEALEMPDEIQRQTSRPKL